MYDLLCTLKLAGVSKGTGTVSMVSFDNITANARLLCDLMDYDLDIHTVDDGADVDAILLGLKNDHCDAILCDAVSNAAAKRLGFHSFLITSGADSIRQAFEQALLLCRSQTRLREENLFFRELLHGQIGQTMVLDDDGHLYLSTQENPPPDLLELLRRELPESKQAGERRIIRNMGGMLYVIRSRRVTSGNLSRTAFFFTVRKSPLSPGQTGIRFSTRPEAEAAFSENIFSFAGTTRGALQADIDRISRSKSPVVVTGKTAPERSLSSTCCICGEACETTRWSSSTAAFSAIRAGPFCWSTTTLPWQGRTPPFTLPVLTRCLRNVSISFWQRCRKWTYAAETA